MNSCTNVQYWVVASRVGCVLSQVIAASGDLPLKLSLTTTTFLFFGLNASTLVSTEQTQ